MKEVTGAASSGVNGKGGQHSEQGGHFAWPQREKWVASGLAIAKKPCQFDSHLQKSIKTPSGARGRENSRKLSAVLKPFWILTDTPIFLLSFPLIGGIML
jgi:hypothetical protein